MREELVATVAIARYKYPKFCLQNFLLATRMLETSCEDDLELSYLIEVSGCFDWVMEQKNSYFFRFVEGISDK
jgi:hypothetical protein